MSAARLIERRLRVSWWHPGHPGRYWARSFPSTPEGAARARRLYLFVARRGRATTLTLSSRFETD